jgi:cytochrome P450
MSKMMPGRPAVASAPVRGFGPTGNPLWYVSRDADVRTVLTCPFASSDPSRPGFPEPEDLDERTPFLIELDAPHHTRLRRLVLPEFTAHAISRLHPELQRSADQLIAAMCAAGPEADFAEAFAKPMASQAICHLLAVPISDGPMLTRIATTLADDSQGPEAQGAAFAAVTDYMEKLIDQRIGNPGPDMFGRLAEAPLSYARITRAELVALAIMLLMAGHDTNAKMIVLGVGTLLDHPDVVARIVTDDAAAHAAVEELLRLHSIGDDDGFRVATADMEVGGVTIPAGEGIMPLVRHANHDPALYVRPDCVDIDRKENRHLAFGTGPHLCLGRGLARAVQATAYRTVFSAIPSLRRALADTVSLQITGWR